MSTPNRRMVLVTGASSGIGAELARCAAADGCDLILAARSLDRLQQLADELAQRHGIRALAVRADLEDAVGAHALHAAVKAQGLRVDVLINNAGYGLFGEFADLELAPQLAMMQLNMTSLVSLSKLFLPDLLATRGRIMNVASTAAFQPGPYMAVYYASKAFVLSFSEALAEELGERGVHVLAFCPGPTASGFQDKAVMRHSALFKGRAVPSSAEVAAAGWRALQGGLRVHIPGWRNWWLAQSIRFSPRRMVTRVVRHMSRPLPES